MGGLKLFANKKKSAVGGGDREKSNSDAPAGDSAASAAGALGSGEINSSAIESESSDGAMHVEQGGVSGTEVDHPLPFGSFDDRPSTSGSNGFSAISGYFGSMEDTEPYGEGGMEGSDIAGAMNIDEIGTGVPANDDGMDSFQNSQFPSNFQMEQHGEGMVDQPGTNPITQDGDTKSVDSMKTAEASNAKSGGGIGLFANKRATMSNNLSQENSKNDSMPKVASSPIKTSSDAGQPKSPIQSLTLSQFDTRLLSGTQSPEASFATANDGRGIEESGVGKSGEDTGEIPRSISANGDDVDEDITVATVNTEILMPSDDVNVMDARSICDDSCIDGNMQGVQGQNDHGQKQMINETTAAMPKDVPDDCSKAPDSSAAESVPKLGGDVEKPSESKYFTNSGYDTKNANTQHQQRENPNLHSGVNGKNEQGVENQVATTNIGAPTESNARDASTIALSGTEITSKHPAPNSSANEENANMKDSTSQGPNGMSDCINIAPQNVVPRPSEPNPTQNHGQANSNALLPTAPHRTQMNPAPKRVVNTRGPFSRTALFDRRAPNPIRNQSANPADVPQNTQQKLSGGSIFAVPTARPGVNTAPKLPQENAQETNVGLDKIQQCKQSATQNEIIAPGITAITPENQVRGEARQNAMTKTPSSIAHPRNLTNESSFKNPVTPTPQKAHAVDPAFQYDTSPYDRIVPGMCPPPSVQNQPIQANNTLGPQNRQILHGSTGTDGDQAQTNQSNHHMENQNRQVLQGATDMNGHHTQSIQANNHMGTQNRQAKNRQVLHGSTGMNGLHTQPIQANNNRMETQYRQVLHGSTGMNGHQTQPIQAKNHVGSQNNQVVHGSTGRNGHHTQPIQANNHIGSQNRQVLHGSTGINGNQTQPIQANCHPGSQNRQVLHVSNGMNGNQTHPVQANNHPGSQNRQVLHGSTGTNGNQTQPIQANNHPGSQNHQVLHGSTVMNGSQVRPKQATVNNLEPQNRQVLHGSTVPNGNAAKQNQARFDSHPNQSPPASIVGDSTTPKTSNIRIGHTKEPSFSKTTNSSAQSIGTPGINSFSGHNQAQRKASTFSDSACTDDSFDDLLNQFLQDIQEGTDLYDKGENDLLKLEVDLSHALAAVLRYKGDMMDLLDDIEGIKGMADSMLAEVTD